MKKLLFISGIIALCICTKAIAQKDSTKVGKDDLMKDLKMSKPNYMVFAQKLGQLNKEIIKILKDNTKNKQEQTILVENIRKQRSAFLKSALSNRQQLTFAEYEQKRQDHSPSKKQFNEQKLRLASRGLKVN